MTGSRKLKAVKANANAKQNEFDQRAYASRVCSPHTHEYLLSFLSKPTVPNKHRIVCAKTNDKFHHITTQYYEQWRMLASNVSSSR